MDKEEFISYFGDIMAVQTYYICPVCDDYYNIVEYFIEMENGRTSYTCPKEHKTED